ncbi:pyridoxal phosphate-dependent aminotransferase [Ancylomarina sp. DW003]|nr:pyridoxal phosphate-dependent aminotransferase [Ancylomarina sp. DW003]MDE5422676.1 pyridoxal phosphate-dependent aminotransferase [Ancylomarina sp. DW003]
MEQSKEYYKNQFYSMVNPEQRASYYKRYINSEVVNLSTAENLLLLKFYQEKAFKDLGQIEAKELRYPPVVYGSPEYMESIAQFLAHQWGASVNPENIFAVSGVSAGLECLAFSLFNEGDEVLIPAPMWYGFVWPFTQRPKLKFIPFQVSDDFTLTKADVERAVDENPNAKLLVLTNPNNPLGVNYSRELLSEIYEFFLADETRHIISDEIYANSQVENKDDFVSALNLDIYQNPEYNERIHVVWGLSKDFGLSGFRVGFIVSTSAKVHHFLKGDNCYKSMSWFSPFGSLNPYMLKNLFLNQDETPNPDLANEAMLVYKQLLKEQYRQTADALTDGNIKFHNANKGALFFWIDLRPYLKYAPESVSNQERLCPSIYEHDSDSERWLTEYIRDKANVLLVRGQECFSIEPGYFRLCYTSEEISIVVHGIQEMIKALEELPSLSKRALQASSV